MLGQLRRVLVDPRAAVADRPTALAGPFALVFALGVVVVGGLLVPGLVLLDDTLSSVLPASPPVSLAAGGETVSVPSLILQIMAFSLAAPSLGWVLTAVVVHGLASLASVVESARGGGLDRPGVPSRGDLAAWLGAFRATLVAVGWGYAPQLLASLVTTALFLAVFLSGAEPVVSALQITPAGHPVVALPTFPAVSHFSHAVGAASVLWTGYVWVGALRATRGLSRRAALAAAGPVALFLLFVSDLARYLVLAA